MPRTPEVPALIVAGTHSGSGTTTATLALLAALTRRGLRVQGFKVGPDFIDPGHHAAITHRTGRNLDTWLMGPEALAASYRRATAGVDLAVIEGVMGLFDGRGAEDEAGSTADLARLWDLPVVLVVDARGLARSIAPMVRGFADFDPAVRVVAAIANRVGSPGHFANVLAPALRGATRIEPVGSLPRREALAIPSRHLGLWTAEEFQPGAGYAEALADAAEEGLALDRLRALAQPPKLAEPPELVAPVAKLRGRVALARDAAFCFHYEDNLDLLRDEGAEVVPFSPLADAALPEGSELLLLGGGYPEVFAGELAANAPLRAAIRHFHAEGGTILAECGGLMACCRALQTLDGRSFPMWDLIPARVAMRDRFQALGYVTIETDGATPFGPAGTRLRGHEFHYSALEPLAPLPFATNLGRPDRPPKPDGIAIGGLLASYAHAHYASNPAVARAILGR